MDYFENSSKQFHTSFSVLSGKLDDCVGTSSLCVKEEFFKQETNIKMFLNESKQCKPLGMIIDYFSSFKTKLKRWYYAILLNLFFQLCFIGDTPKRKQFDLPYFVDTTLRREIIQSYLPDSSESVISSPPSSVCSSESSINGSESNVPSKENSPKNIKVITFKLIYY